MKKSHWSIMSIILLFFGCSPKFTEYNDSGFGGKILVKNNATKALNNPESDESFIKAIQDDSTSSVCKDQTVVAYFDTKITQSTPKLNRNHKKNEETKVKGFSLTRLDKVLQNNKKKSIIPNKTSSFYRWYFFSFAILTFLAMLYAIIDLTGPGAGSSGGVIAVLIGLLGIWVITWFIKSSLYIDNFIKGRCLFTRMGIIIWWFPFFSIPLLFLGLIYDYFKKK